jgi:hypothetical protein
MDWVWLSQILGDTLKILADFFTVMVGVLAVWNIVVHRKKISAFVRLLSNTVLNEKVKLIRETLSELKALDFNEKGDRRQIRNILGSIAGQIKHFGGYDIRFKAYHDEIHEFLENKKSLTEPIKCRLMYELHGLLDAETLRAALTILEDSNG